MSDRINLAELRAHVENLTSIGLSDVSYGTPTDAVLALIDAAEAAHPIANTPIGDDALTSDPGQIPHVSVPRSHIRRLRQAHAPFNFTTTPDDAADGSG